MPASSIYTAKIPVLDLRALAGAAKALGAEVTVAFETPVRFWSKDEQKKCALVGVLDVAECEGAITLRVPTSNLNDLLKTFGKDAILSVEVESDEDTDALSLTFTDGTTTDKRIMTVEEAAKDDVPYSTKVSTAASCEVDVKALAKVLTAYKKDADVVDLKISGSTLEVAYSNRNGKDAWLYATQPKGSGSGKFSTSLLAAATTACKSVADSATLMLSKDGPLRLNAVGDAIACRVYVVASKPI